MRAAVIVEIPMPSPINKMTFLALSSAISVGAAELAGEQADIKRAAAAPKLAPESNLNGERRVDSDMTLGSNWIYFYKNAFFFAIFAFFIWLWNRYSAPDL